MGKVISIINMKGGVGKTTLSIGIADYLSDIGKKVLIIDADPQFNATQALLDTYKVTNYKEDTKNYYTEEILPKSKTVYRLFMRTEELLENQEENSYQDDIIVNLKENLDIVCGDLRLVLINNSGDFKKFIDINKLREKYDFILFDCPPTLTIYTDGALLVSDYYLIPNRIDRYSIVGIDSLQKAIKDLVIEEEIDLKCLGLIYTMVKKDMTQKQNKIRVDFENKKVVKEIDIFSSTLSIVDHIQWGTQGSLPTKYKNSYEDIEAITLELLTKILNMKEE